MTYLSSEQEELVRECTGVFQRPSILFLTEEQRLLFEVNFHLFVNREINFVQLMKKSGAHFSKHDYHYASYKRKKILNYLNSYKSAILSDSIIIEKIKQNKHLSEPLQANTCYCVADWKNMTQDEKDRYN